MVEERLHKAVVAPKSDVTCIKASIFSSLDGASTGWFVVSMLCGLGSQAPLRVPVHGATILVRDWDEIKRARRASQARKRLRFRRANSGRPKARATKPKKTCKNMPKAAPVYATWPVFLPHAIFDEIVSAGLIHKLLLGCTCCECGFSSSLNLEQNYEFVAFWLGLLHFTSQGRRHGLAGLLGPGGSY